jgi:hypothetical protein
MLKKKVKNERTIIGIGSAGLSTMFFLNQKKRLSTNSLLFIKPELESKINKGSRTSIINQKKFDALLKLKEKGIAYQFREAINRHDALTERHLPVLPSEKIFTIVGLGGESGEFLLKIVAFQFFKKINVTHFCHLPFAFEGTKKANKANYQLEKLNTSTSKCIKLENQSLLKETTKTFDDAFSAYHSLIEKLIFSKTKHQDYKFSYKIHSLNAGMSNK